MRGEAGWVRGWVLCCCGVGAALSAGSLKPSWTAGSAEASSAGATGMSGAEAITDSAGLLLIFTIWDRCSDWRHQQSM